MGNMRKGERVSTIVTIIMYNRSYGEIMSNQFDLLAKAKPAALYRLLARLSLEDAAIVLTRLPDTLAFQIIAYFPEDRQVELGPAMVEARWEDESRVEQTATQIRTLLSSAKKNMAAKGGTAVHPAPTPQTDKAQASEPSGAVTATKGEIHVPTTNIEKLTAPQMDATPISAEAASGGRLPSGLGAKPSLRSSSTPVARPSGRTAQGKNANPYQNSAAPVPTAAPEPAPPAKQGLAARAKEMAREVLKSTFSGPAAGNGERSAGNRPQPWVPRAATASPINGPALPGKPPPVAGDPFKSPLAKAGLLDLIGRAQQTVLPKGTIKEPAHTSPQGGTRPVPKAKAAMRPAGKNGRPEPREGVVSRQSVVMSRTPRTIGPRSAAIDAAQLECAATAGARRMDGKAILAAILREAGAEMRGVVQHEDPGLFKQLRERMFYFDDLMYTEDNGLARVFTVASAEDSALALKFAAPALRDRVMRVVSPGRARALRESADRRAGLDDVEKAQKKVLDVALQLQAAGRILIDPRDPDLAG